MGLFQKIFKNSTPAIQTKSYFKMLDGYTPVYTNYQGGIYEMLQTKAVINTIATDCGKAIPEIKKKNSKIEYMLKYRPNPFMTTTAFIERVVTNYLCDNNSFIIPIYDDYERIIGLFPVQYSQVEAIEYLGELYLKYTFPTGQAGVIEYSKVGHLRRMQYKNDLFGDSNRALRQTLEVIHSQNESLTNALKQSGVVRFMAQLSEQLIDKKDFEEQRRLFSEVNFKNDNSQMMLYDSRYKEIKQVESKPIFLDEKQQELIDENIRDYFGVSNNVIQHKFENDYEWNSYYEGVIESILIKLGEALTSILYTPSQIMADNAVYVTTNRLQYMSNESKLSFSTSMFDRGVLNGDGVCDVWNLPHYEGGEKHYIRKEYAEISKFDEETSKDEIQKVEVVQNGGNENVDRKTD